MKLYKIDPVTGKAEEAAGYRYPFKNDADRLANTLLERGEEACSAGLPLEQALSAVRSGYASVEADRAMRAADAAEDAEEEAQNAARACLRCEHQALSDHHAGGCRHCHCVSPFGGLT